MEHVWEDILTQQITNSTLEDAVKKSPRKWVYLFNEGNADMRTLLGGKGAGVAEMTNAGLPVPPGFTITTEACIAYYEAGKRFPQGMWEQVLAALKIIEQQTGKGFGDKDNPLLVSVRSGAKFSMPGMMDTVLNLGINDETVQGLVKLTGDERFAYDAYRRFIQMFSKIVLNTDPADFEKILDKYKERAGVKTDAEIPADQLKQLVTEFKQVAERQSGEPFPTDVYKQLEKAIEAVFSSWNNKRAIDYRNFNKIPHDLGTAVNVQSMVFGNMGNDSGTGVAFTRDPGTGEKQLYGEYLLNAQGEDVVAGIRTPSKISRLQQDLPEVYKQFQDIAQRLERHYRDMQDMEFTVEKGRLYMLQTRSGKRGAQAGIKVLVDMVEEVVNTVRQFAQRGAGHPLGIIDQLGHIRGELRGAVMRHQLQHRLLGDVAGGELCAQVAEYLDRDPDVFLDEAEKRQQIEIIRRGQSHRRGCSRQLAGTDTNLARRRCGANRSRRQNRLHLDKIHRLR